MAGVTVYYHELRTDRQEGKTVKCAGKHVQGWKSQEGCSRTNYRDVDLKDDLNGFRLRDEITGMCNQGRF